MSRTFLRQVTQIRSSDTYADTLSAGSTLQSGASTIQDDLNSLRSQLRRILFEGSASAPGAWYDDLATVNSKTRSVASLNEDLDTIETKKILYRVSSLTDVAVPAAQNFVVLSVAGSEAPTMVAAVALTAEGTVVAHSSNTAGAFEAHELTAIAGPDVLHPKNLVIVRDATTKEVITSGDLDVYALLQLESTGSDGAAFDDVEARVKLSFVRQNAAGTALEAVPSAHIAGKSINYGYILRAALSGLPESAFLNDAAFVDNVGAVDVTLDRAIDNQVGPVTQAQNIDWRISDTYSLDMQTSDGARTLLAVVPNAAGDAVTMNVDDLTVTNANTATFSNGIKVDGSGTAISIGATAGEISSAGALTVASSALSDLALVSADEILLRDVNQSGSTWVGTSGIKLSDTTAEWDNFKTAFGEVSLLDALYQAATTAARFKGVAVVTSAVVAADTNVTGAGGSPNVDAQLPAYVGADFVEKVEVYLNGTLLRNGADAAANNDVYPGTDPSTGDLKFELVLTGGAAPDVITMIVNG